MKIGITERGDAALNTDWMKWVSEDKPAILVSKQPNVVYELLRGMRIKNVIVHATITGYGGWFVEPNVPACGIALAGYNNLIELLGKDRVVLRIDPVISTEKGTEVAKSILNYKKDTRVRISFFDNYKHVKERFRKEETDPLPWDFHAPLDLRQKVWKELGKPEVCGEPGFKCTGCISEKDCEILGVEPIDSNFKQRSACACLGNKVELLKDKKPCFHSCLYCYWQNK